MTTTTLYHRIELKYLLAVLKYICGKLLVIYVLINLSKYRNEWNWNEKNMQPNPNWRHQSGSMYCIQCMHVYTWFIHREALMQFNAIQYTISCQKDQNTNLIIHWTFANCSFEMNKSRDSTEWSFVLYTCIRLQINSYWSLICWIMKMIMSLLYSVEVYKILYVL